MRIDVFVANSESNKQQEKLLPASSAACANFSITDLVSNLVASMAHLIVTKRALTEFGLLFL